MVALETKYMGSCSYTAAFDLRHAGRYNVSAWRLLSNWDSIRSLPSQRQRCLLPADCHWPAALQQVISP